MSSTVGFVAAAVCLACTFTHNSVTDDQCGTFRFCFSFIECATNSVGIVTVDFDNFPAPCFVFFSGIFDCYIFCFG